MPSLTPRFSSSAGQRGLVLVLALIVLAALSLAAVGLMRGVLASNRVAGNLAYQQAAVQAADVGVETAIAWLEQKTQELAQQNAAPAPMTPANKLHNNIVKSASEAYNYVAIRADPAPTQTWEGFWQTLVTNNLVNTLPADAAGNQVSFVIHRLCLGTGDPMFASCEAAPVLPKAIENGSQSMEEKHAVRSQIYYRITVRVQGTRNATSFIQAIVAI